MRIIDTKEIENAVYRMARKAGLRLTPACKSALQNAKDKESSPACKFALDTLLQNADIASAEEMPVCQDTGMAVVLLEIGQEVSFTGALLSDAVNQGVRRAYADGYFRKSVCDPLTRVNTADNTPAVLHTEIVAGYRSLQTHPLHQAAS
jgi:fumarate hydratase subunit alpha